MLAALSSARHDRWSLQRRHAMPGDACTGHHANSIYAIVIVIARPLASRGSEWIYNLLLLMANFERKADVTAPGPGLRRPPSLNGSAASADAPHGGLACARSRT